MAAIYAVYTSPTHSPIPNHLPTLIVTPHGQVNNILYSYLHTNFNTENYLLTPSPQGDLCVAKLFPPRREQNGKTTASDPGHSNSSSSRIVRCEASRNLKWSITNTGVISPIYKLSLPSPDSPDLPLFQISKPNPNASFWSMFYFAYAGHNIPPKRIEFGKIQKNPPGPNGGGTRISITGKTTEEKAVWQTLGEGNEDCVEWVVLCAALNLLDDEILKAAEKAGTPGSSPSPAPSNGASSGRPTPVSLRDPGSVPPPGQGRPSPGPPGPQQHLPSGPPGPQQQQQPLGPPGPQQHPHVLLPQQQQQHHPPPHQHQFQEVPGGGPGPQGNPGGHPPGGPPLQQPRPHLAYAQQPPPHGHSPHPQQTPGPGPGGFPPSGPPRGYLPPGAAPPGVGYSGPGYGGPMSPPQGPHPGAPPMGPGPGPGPASQFRGPPGPGPYGGHQPPPPGAMQARRF